MKTALTVFSLAFFLAIGVKAQTPKTGASDSGQVGIGARLSTLGPGAEVAVSLTHSLNIRGGFNYFRYDRSFKQDGIAYNGQFKLQSAEAHLDWYPVGHGFHLTPGVLVYNGFGATANSSVPGGTTFTLGGTEFLSDPANPITGTGKLQFWKAAPTALFGFGSLVPHTRHWAFNFDMGAVFQGPPRTVLSLAGNACLPDGSNCVNAATDTTVLAAIQAEQAKLNKDLSLLRYYPVIAATVGYRF
jgi:hypothetical protein